MVSQGSHGMGFGVILPPEQQQVNAGSIPLERVRGNLDVTSVTMLDVMGYVLANKLPTSVRITAGVFHDRPYLELVWEPSS